MSSRAAKPVYEDIAKAGEEIKNLTQRSQELQTSKFEKDNQLIELKAKTGEAKDIGTFKFVAQAVAKPLDTVVTAFICVLIAVFDPLAVGLILAFNIASYGSMLKKKVQVSQS